MACTSPRDLTIAKSSKCHLKCLYFYKYGNSSCNVTNASSYLNIMYDGASDVVFNTVKYTPTSIKIFKPSLHTFNGTAAEAEMFIEHDSTQGGLIVCIPISTGGKQSTGSGLLQSIIEDAPSVSDGTVTMNLTNFTANSFIPKSPYFTYTGTMPYATSCTYNYEMLVFPKMAAIAISQESMESLGKAITYSYINTVEGECFFNEKGTNINGFASDNQIFIDCQPVGASDDTVVVTTSTTSESSTKSSKDASDAIKAALVMLFIILVILTFSYLVKVGTTPVQLGKVDPILSVLGLIGLYFLVKQVVRMLS